MINRLLAVVDNPIVAKEGVSRMRTWRTPVIATVYLSLIGMVGYVALGLTVGSSKSVVVASQVGGQAYAWMAFFQLALVGLFTPGLAAGAISGERERQTLDVLLVSRVTALGIVWGKLFASIGFVLLLVFTAFPLFAVVFLFGVIDAGQFLLTQVLTVTTAIALGSLAVFFSALFQRSLPATVVSYAAAAVLMLGTALVALVATLGQSIGAGQGLTVAAAQWYFNPFFALGVIMYPGDATHSHLRGFMQLLLSGPPRTGALSPAGPLIEPWMVTMTMEVALTAACVVGAVALVRGRRGRRVRRAISEETV